MASDFDVWFEGTYRKPTAQEGLRRLRQLLRDREAAAAGTRGFIETEQKLHDLRAVARRAWAAGFRAGRAKRGI